MKARRLSLAVLGLAALALTGTALSFTPGSVTIDSVGGQAVSNGQVKQPLSGAVTATGTASLAQADAPAAAPLVADAGDSLFVATGEIATLLGAGFGGTAPYSFAWSSSAGQLAGADSPTAQLSGAPAGTHTVSLQIKDSAGATATDTVKVVVFTARSETLLDQSKADPLPGAPGTGAKVVFPFQVPAGTSSFDVKISWALAANDYDLRVLDPAGTQRASHGDGVPTTEENTSVSNPEAGTWTVVADKFATTGDTVRARVVGTVASGGDPRPAVVSGGPYRFALGATQALDGTVTGGAQPVVTGWDTDGDGVFETTGTDITTRFAEGQHVVTLKATDANGLERRETTTVLVADPAQIAAQTTPVTVIGVADSGINPYHLEFSAQTYPDPAVLELTGNFSKHPSEYIPGYPKDAEEIPITLGEGYFPAQDARLWNGNETIKPSKLYWIPGTKIVGAIDAGGSTGVTSGEDTRPILDDNGHGSGSASVSAGNRYGYCPTCVLVIVEALDESVVAGLPWVDISTNSFGYVGGIPIGPVVGANAETRAAAERGQTTLFAAGNGVGNAFDVPISTYGSDQTGPDWNVTVGAIRRDNQRAIIGDGIPVHISAWGDGNLPSACRTGTVGQCAFGGTSAATPYTAGVFGTALTEVRRVLGDGKAGQKPGQVVASGLPVDESVFLQDGKLTRSELREAVLKTAQPLNQRNDVSPFPIPLTAPYLGESNVLFEGYGAATPESGKRAVDVLLGRGVLPERPFEEDFFALDRQIRDTIYGGYDRDGNGTVDSEAVAGQTVTPADVSTTQKTLAVMSKFARLDLTVPSQALGSNDLRFYLHRRVAAAPGVTGCAATNNESYLDTQDTAGDLEPCFESRVTSVVAAYRPLGIFPSTGTLDAPLPAGSKVNVDLYIAGETPSVIRPTGVFMATDRELGTGTGAALPVVGSGPGGAACGTLGEGCWTRYQFSFETARPAFSGEQVTFQVQLVGARSWAFGHEGAHASKITVVPAAQPAQGLGFSVRITEPANGSEVTEGKITAGGTVQFPNLGSDPTGAGDHPTRKRVEVSVDDPAFGKPIEATVHHASGTWSAPLGALSRGPHTVYARAAIDRSSYSEAASSTFTGRFGSERRVAGRRQERLAPRLQLEARGRSRDLELRLRHRDLRVGSEDHRRQARAGRPRDRPRLRARAVPVVSTGRGGIGRPSPPPQGGCVTHERSGDGAGLHPGVASQARAQS